MRARFPLFLLAAGLPLLVGLRSSPLAGAPIAQPERLGRGVTVYAGHRGYGSRGEQPSPIDIVFTVVTRLEVSQVTAEVNHLDPKAFIIMHSVNDAKGGMVKKRALH